MYIIQAESPGKLEGRPLRRKKTQEHTNRVHSKTSNSARQINWQSDPLPEWIFQKIRSLYFSTLFLEQTLACSAKLPSPTQQACPPIPSCDPATKLFATRVILLAYQSCIVVVYVYVFDVGVGVGVVGVGFVVDGVGVGAGGGERRRQYIERQLVWCRWWCPLRHPGWDLMVLLLTEWSWN